MCFVNRFLMHVYRIVVVKELHANMTAVYCFRDMYIFSVMNLCHHLRSPVTWWRSWLRQCATSRKVAGSIPDGDGIFH